MCNPNSSALAYRRQRALSLAANAQLESTVMSKPSGGGVLPESFAASLMLRKSGYRDYDIRNDAVTDNAGFSAPPVSYSAGPYTAPTAPEASMMHYVSYYSKPEENLPKKKPKRRRKPQKPGKTAKQNDRHFVVHNYHDHANDADDHDSEPAACGERRRGGVSVSFPQKMHSVLDEVERDGLADVIAWQDHGRCFLIHKPKEFTDHVMPHYFRQTKLTSFQRQLNLYGFNRITRGPDAGGYYHELFLRGKEFLCNQMVRTKVKGTRFKAASSPDQEPDFYSMPPVVVTPVNSDCDHSESSSRAPPVATSYEYREVTAAYHKPRIGNPERYQPYQTAAVSYSPARHPVTSEEAQVPELLSPVAYPNSAASRGYSAMPILTSPSFDGQESPRAVASVPSNQGVLDQAVDDLFLGNNGVPPAEVNDSVMDFVTCWDPSSYGPDAALENDTQLGNLLDKLLWDEF